MHCTIQHDKKDNW